MNKPCTSLRLWLSAAFVLLWIFPAAANQEGPRPVEIKTLAVMPFAATQTPFDKTTAIKDMVDCKIFGLCSWEHGEIGTTTVTKQYQHQLRKALSYKVIPAEQSQSAFAENPPNLQETLRDAARQFGEQTGASHVLTGTVWRYRERIGSAMAIEKPAAVGFTAILVRSRDGMILWSKPFEKTQASLSENLLDAPLFFKKGLHWLTAEELTAYGVEETLRSFPGH